MRVFRGIELCNADVSVPKV